MSRKDKGAASYLLDTKPRMCASSSLVNASSRMAHSSPSVMSIKISGLFLPLFEAFSFVFFSKFKQFNFLTTEKLGYDDTDIVGVHKPFKTHDEAQLFKNELLKDPNIVSVAPRNGGRWGTVARSPEPGGAQDRARQ